MFGDKLTWHVTPVNDEKEHVEDGENCHCCPRVQVFENGTRLVVHRSYDGRELVKEAAAIFSDPDRFLG